MKEFTLGDKTYSVGALDAFSQLHVGLKLAPGLAAMAQGSGTSAEIMTILGTTSPEDIDYVLHLVLKCVKRKDGQGWAPVYIADARRLAFEDLSGIDLLQIAAQVVGEYLTPFFLGLTSMVSGTEPSTAE